MTKQKAREKGLVFTGHYDRDSEKIDSDIAKLRKEYPDCKFYKVTIPDNPLSRSCCISHGYSIYASRLYDILRSISSISHVISQHDNNLKYLQDAYQKQVDEENTRYQNNLEILKKLHEEKQELLKK